MRSRNVLLVAVLAALIVAGRSHTCWSQAAPTQQAPSAGGPPLVGVFLLADEKKTLTEGLSNFGGLYVGWIPFLNEGDQIELAKSLQPFYGRPISGGMAREVARVITVYIQRKKGIKVSCTVPEQKITTGTLQIVVASSDQRQGRQAQVPIAPEPAAPANPSGVLSQAIKPKNELGNSMQAEGNLRGLVLVPDLDSVKLKGISEKVEGLVITNVPNLSRVNARDISQILDNYLNKPISSELIRNLRLQIEEYLRGTKHGANMFSYYPSKQTVTNGVIQMVLGQRVQLPKSTNEVSVPFHGLVLLPDETQVQDKGVARGPHSIEVRGVKFLIESDVRAIEAIVRPFLGQPMREDLLDDVQSKIIKYLQSKKGVLTVDMFYPEQTVPNDSLVQVVVTEGPVNQIRVVNPGRKNFSDKLIKNRLTLKEGEPLRIRRLERDMDWLNRNPLFREVTIQMVKPQDPNAPTSSTDVEVVVKDEKWPINYPIRPYIGFENSGIKLIGENRVLAGLNYGNLFGWDHQISYQYIADTEFKFFKSHVGSYTAPLPWHNTLSFFGYYATIEPDLSVVNLPGFTEKDKNYQGSLRYSIPLPTMGRFKHELYVGGDFKHIESVLAFGVDNPLVTSKFEVMQVTAGYDLSWRDPIGQTTLSLSGFYSPGNLGGANEDANFSALRAGAESKYYYGIVSGRRDTILPWRLTWRAKGSYQYTSKRLMPSEEFGLGGWNNVRGYGERALNGDKGFFIANELLSPTFEFNWFGWQPERRASLQFLGFFDYGQVKSLDGGSASIDSVGAGLRFGVGKNVDLRLDYGYGLKKVPTTLSSSDTSRGRVHVGALVGF